MVLSASDKVIIETCFSEKGWTGAKIVRMFPGRNFKKTTVNNLIKKIKETGSTKRKPGSGRKKSALNKRHVDYVKEVCLSPEEGTFLSQRKIAEKLKISRTSVQRIQKSLKFNAFKKVAPLKQEKRKMQSDKTASKPTIVVTGFGPFGKHSVNASWIAVETMIKQGGVGDHINLVAREIPVEYEAVQAIVPQLWKEYKPAVMIHVGVSSISSDVLFEQCAHNSGYVIPDVGGKLPASNCCQKKDEDRVINSDINMHKVSEEVRKLNPEVMPLVSNDTGRYLCDFIYYTSLAVSRKTAFIHVPVLNQPYSADQLATCLKNSVKCIYEEACR